MTFEIIKNAPLPEKLAKPIQYPFANMELNDAFDVPSSEYMKTSSEMQYYQRKHGMKFSLRKFEADYRCYRVG